MRLLQLIVITAGLFLSTAYAASYTAPSGYLQIIGYKLHVTKREGKPEISVTGSFEALADCSGATVLFDVLDRRGTKLGTYRISYGPFYRHDGGELAPGTYTPEGGDAGNVIAADHIAVSEAECVKRR
jgi:hypothetical protein